MMYRRLILGAVAISAAIALSITVSPKPELRTFTSYSTAMFDRHGELLRITLAEDERYRLYQPIDAISEHVQAATILYEDQSYYDHAGVDIVALVRAFWVTYVLRDRRVGASTIVMQVARLRWGIASHTLLGKFQQIVRALQLVRHYSKREILEFYLNLAPYGGNVEGIGAASWVYFNKPAADLSFPEALTLAVIPQNPNKRNPVTESGQQALAAAREVVYQRWRALNPNMPHNDAHMRMPLMVRELDRLPFIAPHFTHYVMSTRSRWEHGEVNTTLDRGLQQDVERRVRGYLESHSALGMENAAALLLNYETMEIEAMVGSADYFNAPIHGQVNGTLAKRSPGSTLKPFVYGLAIDDGVIHPMSLLKDAPKQYGGFTPENYDKQFRGPMVAKEALIDSRNVPAVWLQAQLTSRSFYEFLQDAGVKGLVDASFYGLALALGGGELSMMELVSLYASLGNLGVLKPIKVDRAQKTLDQGKRILSAEASFLVLDMLKDNASPHAVHSALSLPDSHDVAWKTGTSWAFRDAWAVGVSGPYVVAVWVGNFDGRGNPAFVGRTAAGPLLFSLFDVLASEQLWKVDSLLSSRALNLKKVRVCRTTGDLYEKGCPSTVESWFIPGVSPIQSSNIYRSVAVDVATGLRVCEGETGSSDVEIKTFAFWPSDLLAIFAQAGISLNPPPHYMPGCSVDHMSATGMAPVITSPRPRMDYMIPSGSHAATRTETVIPFTATVDPDVDTLFWFVDSQYVGESPPGEPFFWTAQHGEYRVRVVDDAGRSANTRISVMHTP